jgi:ferritin-like metal-binding protein YciE
MGSVVVFEGRQLFIPAKRPLKANPARNGCCASERRTRIRSPGAPMPVHTLRDLFRHSLGVQYDAEQQILGTLDEMETETRSTALRDRLRLHRDETQHQIQNIERCFELIGTDAPRAECAVARGLREEKRAFRRESPSPEAIELYDLHAASRTESYEIASYRGLSSMAAALELDDVRRLLLQNLRQEEDMSGWLEAHSPELLEDVQGALVGRRETP